MTDNLLRNPSFEGLTRPGGYTHDTWHGEVHGNFVSPEGWVGFWTQANGYRRPETKVIQRVPPFTGPPCRIHDGDWAAMMFVAYHRWDGGWYTIVDGLTPGQTYRATFAAHAWCNQPGLPYDGNPNCAPMGCGPLYCDENDLPPLNGDPVNDAWWAALFRVGIQFLDQGEDPNPLWGSDLYYGLGAAIYNGFADVPPLELQVPTERLAFIVRGSFRWDFRNNDAYFDAARLEPVGAGYDYERYMVVLPQSATAEQAVKTMREHHPFRHTVGFSLDDCVNREPRCSKVTVEVVRPQDQGGKAAILNHWDTFFERPDEVIWTDDEPTPPAPNPLLVWQADPEWADLSMDGDDCNLTIAQAGCFISCMAMAQRFYDLDAQATPVDIDDQLGPAGYNNCDVAWRNKPDYVGEQTWLSISAIDKDAAAGALGVGNCVFAEVAPGPPTHWVLVYHDHVEGLVALDPLANEARPFDMNEGETWRLVTPYQVPTPPDDRSHVGPHIQTAVGWETEFVEQTHCAVKMVGGLGELMRFAQAYPPGLRVYRHWVPEQNLDRDPVEAMTQYVAEFSPQLYDLCDQMAQAGIPTPYVACEGWNETYGTFDPRLAKAIDMDMAFIDALAALGLPVVPVVFCAAVGNPHESEWAQLRPLAQKAAAHGGYFGYHGYWYANQSESGLLAHWLYLAGRWTEIDAALDVPTLRWFSGEMGAVGGHYVPDVAVAAAFEPAVWLRPQFGNVKASDWKPEKVFVPANSGYVLLPSDGWLSGKCYGGDWNRCLGDLLLWHRLCSEWNAEHGGRFDGGTVFTTFGDPPQGWQSFAFLEAQMRSFAAALG